MFADDTNFTDHTKDRKSLSHTINTEIVKINHCFKGKKLSLNAKKSNYTLFHKPSI